MSADEQISHEQAWAEWLGTDAGLPRAKKSHAPVTEPTAPRPKTTVQIDIRLPKLQAAKVAAQARQQLSARSGIMKKVSIGAVGVILFGVVIVNGQHWVVQPIKKHLPQAVASVHSNKADRAGAAVTAAAASAGDLPSSPTFHVLTPTGKPELGKIGTPKTAYDTTRNSFSYQDIYVGNEIIISEQPLPDKYGSEAAALAKIAPALHAKEPIVTAQGGALMYTDAKSNAQSIVYVSRGVITFVQSPFKKPATIWSTYLDSLQ